MTASEIIRKVKQIEYKSRKKTNALFLGEYHSSFKGMGMTFSEIRPYQFGDDVRKIDWNKTARFNEPYIKTFEEERELTLMIMIDVSKSLDFGTRKQLKRETIAEISATLGFSAITNNDKVGLILFSDKIHKVVPPKKGKATILRIVREIIDFKPIASPTYFDTCFDYAMKTIKRKSILFTFSDFDDLKQSNSLKAISKKHDLNLIRIYDEKEKRIPNIGWINFKDLETNQTFWINTSSSKSRQKIQESYLEKEKTNKSLSQKNNFNYRSIRCDEDYIKPLLSIFKNHHRNS